MEVNECYDIRVDMDNIYECKYGCKKTFSSSGRLKKHLKVCGYKEVMYVINNTWFT